MSGKNPHLPLDPCKHWRIGIFRLSALGDLVLVSGIVPHIREYLPHASITWITSPVGCQLLEGLEGVEFIAADKPESLRQWLRCRRQLRGLSFDILLCMQASMSAHLLYPLIPADTKLGFDRRRGRDGHGLFVNSRIDYADEHLADGFMRFATSVTGQNSAQPRWALPLTIRELNDAEARLADGPAGARIAVVLHSSKPERNWPLSSYLELMQALADKGSPCRFTLLGRDAPAEKEAGEWIAERVDVLNLIGRTTAREMAALIANVNVLVAPDSGPVHIARALGTPVVGLYAVARPQLSGPYRQLDYVVDQYPAAVEQCLKNSAGQAGWHERVHHTEAMKLITVEQVLDKCRQALAAAGSQ